MGGGRIGRSARRGQRAVIETLERRQLLSTLPANFSETTVASISTPKAATMAFAPDGRLFVADSNAGQIRVIKNGALLGTAALTITVDHAIERGINGIAFAPNFSTAAAGSKYVFVYYTRPDPAKPNVTPSNAKNRLSRFTVSTTSADQLDPASEVVLLDNIDATAGNHNGGTLAFGADGMLYLAVGEAHVPAQAQDMSLLNGKVLRINAMDPAHLIPTDNPFVGASGVRPEIWASGFRNPFSGAIKPGTNTLYVNDVGEASWEEIDNVAKGKNYGWPVTEGVANNPAYVDPVYAYAHTSTLSGAITGGAFYEASQFPSSFHDKYFFGDYMRQTIGVFDPATKTATPFASGTQRPTAIAVSPTDGKLYYLGVNGRVERITYTPPTTNVTLHATADAYVRDGSFAGQNFGQAADLQVKKDVSPYNRVSYLKFDISGGGAVTAAKLWLYGKFNSAVTNNTVVEAAPVASTTWGENTITWNTRPTVGATALAKFTVSGTTAKWYSVDLTPYVQQQKAAGKTQITIALRGAVAAVMLPTFSSDEGSSSTRPALVVTRATTSSSVSAATSAAPLAARPTSALTSSSGTDLWAQFVDADDADGATGARLV